MIGAQRINTLSLMLYRRLSVLGLGPNTFIKLNLFAFPY